MPLYTPFMEKLGAQMGGAIQQQERNKLAQGAYMGDQQAMSQLQGFDPQLAQQIQSGQERKQQLEIQQANLAQKQKADAQKRKNDILGPIFEKMGQFDTYEEAASFAVSQAKMQGMDVEPPPREQWEQSKQLAIKKPTGESPIARMQRELAALPEGDPRRDELQRGLDAAISKGGLSGAEGAAPKAAKTALFKDVVAGQQGSDAIQQIETRYEPEFLTYKGSATSKWKTFLNKLDPKEKDAFTQRRTAFITAVNQDFLKFRKWATGVSGGEKEMAEIKRATFSEDDSPQDFEAKLQMVKSLRRRLTARSRAALKAGINSEEQFDEYIKEHDLDSVPTLQMRGEQLEKQGYKEQQIMEILKQEGYAQ